MFVHKLRKQLSPCHLAMFGMLCISGCSKKTDNVTYFIKRERREHAKQYVISLIVKYL